jgi:hypothetical protein
VAAVPGEYDENPAYVMTDGTISDTWGVTNTTVYSVRPGTAIDLANVLYAAPITGAKGTTVGTMNAVAFGSEIKLTILDNANLGLSISDAPRPACPGSRAGPISLDFSGAQYGFGQICILRSSQPDGQTCEVLRQA